MKVKGGKDYFTIDFSIDLELLISQNKNQKREDFCG